MNNLLSQFGAFAANPMQYLAQRRLNIPQQYGSDPKAAIQYLMDSGQMDQNTYNRLQTIAGQIQANPMFRKYMESTAQGR